MIFNNKLNSSAIKLNLFCAKINLHFLNHFLFKKNNKWQIFQNETYFMTKNIDINLNLKFIFLFL
jgi:hypothetical protein